jgi:hypothetical protein
VGHSQNRIVHQSLLLSRLLSNFPDDASNILHAYGEVPFRRVTYLSQLLQALCLRQESEHYRRGRDFSPGVAAGGHKWPAQKWRQHAAGTMGTMYWMLNSDYPSPNWGSVDVEGNWRLTHYAMAQCYSPLLVTAVVATLLGSEPPPPPPRASPTCQRHFDMNKEGTTISQFDAASPNDCCAACGKRTAAEAGGACKAYSWLGGHCYLSNSSGYHSADPRDLVSGLCTDSACTTAACSKCGSAGPMKIRSLVVHLANDHYAADGGSAAVGSSALKLELIRFADGASMELPLASSPPVQSGSGAVMYSAAVADVLRTSHGLCDSVAVCFALATFRDTATRAGAIANTDGGPPPSARSTASDIVAGPQEIRLAHHYVRWGMTLGPEVAFLRPRIVRAGLALLANFKVRKTPSWLRSWANFSLL